MYIYIYTYFLQLQSFGVTDQLGNAPCLQALVFGGSWVFLLRREQLLLRLFGPFGEAKGTKRFGRVKRPKRTAARLARELGLARINRLSILYGCK